MVHDERADISAVSATTEFAGTVIAVTKESFYFSDELVTRDVVRHPGAVAVVALRDVTNEPEILLVRQYRHPVNMYLWELPAGLRDIPGESAQVCARRELQEETGFDATDFEHLVTAATTPGGSDEVIQLYLTVDPVKLLQRPTTGEAEEADMTAQWVPLAAAVTAVESGQILNGIAQLGILLAALRVRRNREILAPGL